MNMKCSSLIVFFYCSFYFGFCLALSSIPFIDKVSEKIGEGVNEAEEKATHMIENSNLSSEHKEVAHGTKRLVAGFVRTILPKRVEGEQLFLRRNCISHKFSRKSLDKYHNSMVDHPYQCATLNNETNKFSRIIGCETGSRNFNCYGITATDSLPEPDYNGSNCYEVENNSYKNPDCQCVNLLIHAGIHAISAAIICIFLVIFYFKCRAARRVSRKQPEDIDFDFVKHNRSILSH